jgi:hypothetical protein
MPFIYVSELLPLPDILFITQMTGVGERRWNDTDRGKQKNSEKNLSHCHLSTTDPTWIDPGANQGLRGDRP